MTNILTAAAATRSVTTANQGPTLLGIFTAPNATRILIRTRSGAVQTLTAETPQDGLTLMETGDGWALLRDGNQIRRLVIG